MLKLVQKLAAAPPTGSYSPVEPLKPQYYSSSF